MKAAKIQDEINCYRCFKCKKKYSADQVDCGLIDPPARCICGCVDFELHVDRYIKLNQPLKFITCTFKVGEIIK